MVDDRDPIVFFFTFIETGSLHLENATLYSTCGGIGPAYFFSIFKAVASNATLTVDAAANRGVWIDSKNFTTNAVSGAGTGRLVRAYHCTANTAWGPSDGHTGRHTGAAT